VMSRPQVVIGEDAPGAEALALLRRSGLPGAPVVDADGSFLGTVATAQLAVRAADGAPARALTDVTASAVAASAGLDVGLEALMDAGGQWLTVTSGDRRVAGILSAADLVRGYQQVLGASASRLAPVTRNSAAIDLAVGRGSPLAGRAIRDGGLPPGSVIVAIRRDGQNIPVSGGTVIHDGDMLSMFASAGRLSEVTAAVHDPGRPETPGGGQPL